MAYTPGINSLLERLLPKGWQSQVASTFGPKRFDELSSSEWTPGKKTGNDEFKLYKDYLAEGLMPTQKAYDYFTVGKDIPDEVFNKEGANFSDFWVDPSQMDPVNVFDPNSLMAGFQRAGLHDANKGMFTPFQASDLRAVDPSSYSAQMEKDRSNLAGQLQNRLAAAGATGGGFAGYGGRTQAQDLATQQFQSGAEGLYADINKQRAGAVGSLYSKLEDYDKLISQAT